MIIASFAAHFDAVVCNGLALLLQNADHVDRRAASQRDQKQFHRCWSASPIVVRIKRKSMTRRTDTNKEIVSGVVYCGLRIFRTHQSNPPRRSITQQFSRRSGLVCDWVSKY